MHTSKWRTSRSLKACTGCDLEISPSTEYLEAKFTIDVPFNNVTKLIAINLCVDCIKDFENYAKDPKDVVDNLNEPI